ncbi:MAG: cohesin domain-containing protein [Nitrososphaerota archaeon]
MNKIKVPVYITLLILILVTFLPIVFAFDEVIVSMGDFQLKVGDEMEVPVEIINSVNIAGGYVKIEYDKSILNVTDIKEGDFLSPIIKIERDKGLIFIAVASPTAVGKSKATLAIIKFTALSSGASLLKISYAELNDERGEVITPKVINGKITVTVEEKESDVTTTLTQTFISTVTVTYTHTLTTTQTFTQKLNLEIADILSNFLPYALLITIVIIFLIVLKIYRSYKVLIRNF